MKNSSEITAAISPNTNALSELVRINKAMENIMNVIPNRYNGADPKKILVPSNPAKGTIAKIAI